MGSHYRLNTPVVASISELAGDEVSKIAFVVMLSEADIFNGVSLHFSIITVFLHVFAVLLVSGVDAGGWIGVLEVMGIVVDIFWSPENV